MDGCSKPSPVDDWLRAGAVAAPGTDDAAGPAAGDAAAAGDGDGEWDGEGNDDGVESGRAGDGEAIEVRHAAVTGDAETSGDIATAPTIDGDGDAAKLADWGMGEMGNCGAIGGATLKIVQQWGEMRRQSKGSVCSLRRKCTHRLKPDRRVDIERALFLVCAE
jgi:hypothetical protein